MTDRKCLAGREPRILATPEFIERNKLALPDQDAIAARVEEVQKNDMFGFRTEILMEHLGFDKAVQFLNEEARATYGPNGPEPWHHISDITEVAQDFLDYMVFAWMKAEDERGLSASRSVMKLGEWLWLLGRGDLTERINDEALYNPYGAPALIVVCRELGIEPPADLVEFAKHKQGW